MNTFGHILRVRDGPNSNSTTPRPVGGELVEPLRAPKWTELDTFGHFFRGVQPLPGQPPSGRKCPPLSGFVRKNQKFPPTRPSLSPSHHLSHPPAAQHPKSDRNGQNRALFQGCPTPARPAAQRTGMSAFVRICPQKSKNSRRRDRPSERSGESHPRWQKP